MQGTPRSMTGIEPIQMTLSPYVLDKYEVTSGRFRQFVNAFNIWRSEGNPQSNAGTNTTVQYEGEYSSPIYVLNGAGTGWSGFPLAATATDIQVSYGTAWTDPVSNVTWSEAFAFCIWDGGFLPTESEWEFAASDGGTSYFPWGNGSPTCGLVNFDSSSGYCFGGASTGGVAPVGSFSSGASTIPSPGFQDLAGNVAEWNFDCYGTYPTWPSTTNYAATSGQGRVIRGGDWNDSSAYLPAGSRSSSDPLARSPKVGFRCARLP